MDIAQMLSDLGEMAKEIQKPMTLADAIDIVDPDPKKMLEIQERGIVPDSIAAGNAMTLKARMMVAEYARRKFAEENQNAD